MKKLPLALAFATAMIGTGAQADTIFGLFLGVDGWNMDSSGSFGNSQVEMQDFSLGTDTKISYFVTFEHPVPLLPNLRIRGNDLSTEGTQTLGVDFDFGGQTFTGEVDADFEIQNTDFTLYYEIFDNDTLSFDLGLTGKYLDGDITVVEQATATRATESFKGVVPLFFGAVTIGVPATGLSVFGELNALSIDNNTIQDYQAGLAYSFVDSLAIDLSVRAGYREFSLELDDLDGVFTDWSFDGPFMGLQAHF